jgi:D-beta-D-heptose 7-phosphate kinase/D-beta-D-heptose 1-phosphate adenosyltransferase
MNRPHRPPRIIVVGDVMLDRYTWGNVDRLSPEAPIPVLSADQEEVRPGGAASVAMLARHLEAEVTLLGVVGDDPEANVLTRILEEHQVDAIHLLPVADRPTTCKHRYIGRAAGRHPHQMLRVDRESTADINVDAVEKLMYSFESQLDGCQAVLIADYGKGVCTARFLHDAIARCRKNDIPVLVDPARGVEGRRYQGATLATPNRIEGELLAAEIVSTPHDALRVAAKLRLEFALNSVIVTLDREGLVVADFSGIEYLPTTPREVYDITGAGDMVLAMCGYGYAAGWGLRESAKLANVAAGLQVERFGVEPVEWPDIEARLTRSSSVKVCDFHAAAAFASAARREGRRIVFTNGCFDLFHSGHLRTIEVAAAQGEVLIVAINSDASVRRLKGHGRPIIPAEQRAHVLAALECIDRVVVFDEETPHALLHAIRPDVLVKGGSTNQVVGSEIVEAYGGRIHRADLVPGLSTTGILERLPNSISGEHKSLTGETGR